MKDELKHHHKSKLWIQKGMTNHFLYKCARQAPFNRQVVLVNAGRFLSICRTNLKNFSQLNKTQQTKPLNSETHLQDNFSSSRCSTTRCWWVTNHMSVHAVFEESNFLCSSGNRSITILWWQKLSQWKIWVKREPQ